MTDFNILRTIALDPTRDREARLLAFWTLSARHWRERMGKIMYVESVADDGADKMEQPRGRPPKNQAKPQPAGTITPAAAKAAGLNFYFSGTLCKRGHISKRYINGTCYECHRLACAATSKARTARGKPINAYMAITEQSDATSSTGYSAIAGDFAIIEQSDNAAMKIDRRFTRGGDSVAKPQPRHCIVCGELIALPTYKSHQRGRPKRYCSNGCRQRAHRARAA